MRMNPTIFLVAAVLLLAACQDAKENQTGSEYMPDMAHSIAYEANTYFDYYQNSWEETSVKNKYDLAQPGTPVKGTVPRGYAGYSLAEAGESSPGYQAEMAVMNELYGMSGKTQTISTPVNGYAPYYYVDTEADRARAIAEMPGNPFPITVDGLKRGAELYNLFCAICHGEKGDGNGYIYELGTYPAAPRNFLEQTWVDTSAGLYYHAMMYGKNVMGAYSDKVSYEERWQIIHHIRALQAKEFEQTYDAETNTLTPGEAQPVASNPQYAAFLESFSPEPIDVESAESTSPGVVGSPGPLDDVQLGQRNPAAPRDSTAAMTIGSEEEDSDNAPNENR